MCSKANRKSQKLSPLAEMVKNLASIAMSLNFLDKGSCKLKPINMQIKMLTISAVVCSFCSFIYLHQLFLLHQTIFSGYPLEKPR